MSTRKKQQSPEFEHWHVLGPILWAVVVYTAAGALSLATVPPLYVAGVGFGSAVLAALVSIYRRYAFTQMVCITAFLTWTTSTTPWARWPALVACAGAVLFGMSYHALRKHEVSEDEQAEKLAKRSKYVGLLERVKVTGLKEAGRTPFAAGKTVHLLLPIDGSVTLAKLQERTEALDIAAARAGLKCTFEFERGRNAATVDMHVFDRDILAETIPLPFDRGPKSISDPIPLGLYATGEECSVRFREVAALMVGLKGRGKSGLINTHLAWMTGCTDAVVWMLDGKGGETILPWIRSYLDGETSRPPIDWPAVTEAEFDAVLLAADAVRRFRSSNQRPGPNASRPAVEVIVEEASVITGVSRYGRGNRIQMAQDGVTLGRSSFLDWLFATQRATLDMLGSGSMKTNLDLRYGMGVRDVQEGRMVFPDGEMARALNRLSDSHEHRGAFLMQAPGVSRVMPVKGYWVDPSVVPSIAASNAQWAATLDDETAQFVHETLERAGVPGGYFGRWDRIRESLGRTPGSTESPVPAVQAQPSQAQYDGSRGRDAVKQAVERSRAKRETETFEALIRANFGETDPETGTAPETVGLPEYPNSVPPILKMIMAVFHGHGMPDKLPSKVICGELPGEMSPKALGLLMGHCNVSPIQNLVWDGKPVRGYARDDIETAIKRGSWPPAAFDWQP